MGDQGGEHAYVLLVRSQQLFTATANGCGAVVTADHCGAVGGGMGGGGMGGGGMGGGGMGGGGMGGGGMGGGGMGGMTNLVL